MSLPPGVNWIIGGVVAAVLLPALALVAALPFALAGFVAALAGGGLVVLLAPRRRFEGLDLSGIARGRVELVSELLSTAQPLAERMEEASRTIKAPAAARRVRHLAAAARAILEALERDPLRLDRVRRFLTYYLPRSAEISEAYVALERQPAPDAGRLAAAGDMLDRLDAAFARYAQSLQDADLDKLDIELKLLKSSLDEDLGADLRARPGG
jgi:5-bromo-4-chloroindolyl phosphate hydrolysis protein